MESLKNSMEISHTLGTGKAMIQVTWVCSPSVNSHSRDKAASWGLYMETLILNPGDPGTNTEYLPMRASLK